MSGAARRGWRQRIEPGIYRAHRVGCVSTTDQRPGRRCRCPFQIAVPGRRPGTTRLVTVSDTITKARSERRRLLAEGRSEDETLRLGAGESLDSFATTYFRLKSASLAPATIRGREEDYLRRISPRLGNVALQDLTRALVEEWLAELVRTAASHRMLRQTAATFRAILSAAVDWGWLDANPASKLRLPQPPPQDGTAAERVLTEDQLIMLFTVGARTPRVE